MPTPTKPTKAQADAAKRAEACERDIDALLKKYRCRFRPRVLYEADRQTIAQVQIRVEPLA